MRHGGKAVARPVDTRQNHIREERPAAKDDRSLGELFAELSRETTTLVREEVALAKAEMSQKASQVGRDVGFLVAGGAVVYAGFLALMAALIIGLGQAGLTWWVSALVVGIVVAAVGAFLVFRGIENLRRVDPAPKATLETLKEDGQWAKEQTK
jgi:tetrahydromethanopterin S-methyltransferase subunit G